MSKYTSTLSFNKLADSSSMSELQHVSTYSLHLKRLVRHIQKDREKEKNRKKKRRKTVRQFEKDNFYQLFFRLTF
jgi:hypothetical protein